ncbi:hypothetical protein MXEN_09919 [Mycobacterium xenopi RIVM700367]|nr:hypothetical protein MXEN_09919 [Mycobacterium xenopi RIVM700367]
MNPRSGLPPNTQVRKSVVGWVCDRLASKPRIGDAVRVEHAGRRVPTMVNTSVFVAVAGALHAAHPAAAVAASAAVRKHRAAATEMSVDRGFT